MCITLHIFFLSFSTIVAKTETHVVRNLKLKKYSAKAFVSTFFPIRQGFSELFVPTELPNNELTSIHTPDLPHLLL